METELTERGFKISKFTDRYGVECSLQASSLAEESCVWLGINDADPQIMTSKVMDGGTGWVNYPIHPDVFINTKMHLTQEMVQELLPYLQKFAETGEL